MNGELLARGLAFCSFMDQPCKKRGRIIAEGRAMKALQFATDDGSSFAFLKSLRPEVEQILEESGIDLWPTEAVQKMLYMREIPEVFRYKAEYRPLELSEKEAAAVSNFVKKLKERQAAESETTQEVACG
jgi:RPA family protein